MQVLGVSILGIVKVFQQRQVSVTTMLLLRKVSLYQQKIEILYISSKILQGLLWPALNKIHVQLLQV